MGNLISFDTADLRAAAALKLAVRRRVLPGLLAGQPLRVWLPAFRRPEDVYATTICLLETLGPRFPDTWLRVFATSEDGELVARGRGGVLSPEAAEAMARRRLSRYFLKGQSGCQVKPLVRNACLFAPHRLGVDLRYSAIDIIVCRGVLGKLTPYWQKKALEDFHQALKPGGLLLLGPAEDVGERPDLFGAVDWTQRLYASREVQGLPPGGYAENLLSEGSGGDPCRPPKWVRRTFSSTTPLQGLLEQKDTINSALEKANRELSLSNSVLREALEELEKAQARLVSSEEKYRTLFSRASDAILIVDEATDIVVDANEAACRLFGRVPMELEGLPAERLCAGRSARRPRGRRKDGTAFPAEVSESPFDWRGRRMRMRLVRDLSERLLEEKRRREEERRRLHDSFIANVSHELRTPIAAIRCCAETLLRGVPRPAERKEFKGILDRQAARLQNLVDSLLELSALESKTNERRPAPVYAREAASASVAALAPYARRRGVTVKVSVPKGLRLRVDPLELPAILENLIDNAIKYNRPDREVLVQGRAEGKRGVLSVTDTGLGIPPAELESVFERFHRCENARHIPGNGLGLAIIRGLVEANGGRIWAQSSEAGSTFYVALPLARG